MLPEYEYRSYLALLNAKVSDRSQAPLMFDLSLSESAGSGSLDRMVELSRCAANTLPHRTTYAIQSQMTAALVSRTLAAFCHRGQMPLLSVEFLAEVW